uniref:hypothetical protein n=1 Tax=Mycoplasma elephantis TaxID=114882 RepID=UPI000483E2A9
MYKENFLIENKKYFNKDIISEIERWFFGELNNENKNIIENNIIENNFSINLMWTIISITKLKEIKHIFFKTINDSSNIEKNELYKIETQNLPKSSEFFILENTKNANIRSKKYAYENNKSKSKNNKNINYFDSKIELNFLKKLNKRIIDNENSKYQIKVWTKNPVFHGLYLEYLDEEASIATSYPDFVVKIIPNEKEHSNKKEYCFYIEVKDINDKSNKVTNIIKGYEKYFENENISLFEEPDKNNLTLILAKVDGNEGSNTITFYGSSSNEKIQKLLKENNNKQRSISFLNELFEKIN